MMTDLNPVAKNVRESFCVTRKSFDGYNFELENHSWKLNRDVTIPVGLAKALMEPQDYLGFIEVLSSFAVNSSGHHTSNLFYVYYNLLQFAQGMAVTTKLILSYREKIGFDKEYKLGVVRILIARWVELDLPGKNVEVASLLNSWTFPQNRKGDAVRRLDPNQGPLSDLELQSVLEDTSQAFESGALDLQSYSITVLAAASGRRSVQLTALKLVDLIDRKTHGGGSRYFVSIPRAKQRGSEFRSECREIEIIKEIWDILELQKKCTLERVNSVLWCELPQAFIPDVPLYLNELNLRNIDTVTAFVQANQGDYLHLPSMRIGAALDISIKNAGVYSERTNSLLHIFPKRFRYTLGTRAAREGCKRETIAELLDHTDLQSVDCYTLNVPEYAARIDEAVGQHLTPYAKAFKGELVDNKSCARRGDIPGSDIRDFTGKATGTCGLSGFCPASVPVPCYTCIHFQPWLEGPHTLIYQQLLADRARVESVTADPAITAVLDRTIIAVAEVIKACDLRHEVLNTAGDGREHG